MVAGVKNQGTASFRYIKIDNHGGHVSGGRFPRASTTHKKKNEKKMRKKNIGLRFVFLFLGEGDIAIRGFYGEWEGGGASTLQVSRAREREKERELERASRWLVRRLVDYWSILLLLVDWPMGWYDGADEAGRRGGVGVVRCAFKSKRERGRVCLRRLADVWMDGWSV